MKDKEKKYEGKSNSISLAWRYIRGYKKNTLLCILGIAFSVMLMFSVIQMGDRVWYQFRMAVAALTPWDFQVVDCDMEQMDEIYTYLIENHPEFTVTMITSYGVSRLGDSLEMIQINGIEGEPLEELYDVEFIVGGAPEGENEICLEEQYCNYLGKSPEELLGKEITLTVEDNGGSEYDITYTVSGVTTDIPINSVYYYMFTTWQTAADQINTYSFQHSSENDVISVVRDRYSYQVEECVRLQTELWNRFAPGDKEFFREHIRSNETKDEIFQEEESNSSVAMIFYGVSLLIALCLIIFVYNTISISMTEKIGQYGTMRCIGLDRGGMIKIMGTEVLFYVLFGLGLGMLGGTMLNDIVADKVILYLANVESEAYHKSFTVYVATTILTMLSVLLALLTILVKIWKLRPVEMVHDSGSESVRLRVRGQIREKGLLQAMAVRNLQRNKSRSRVLYVTLTISGVILMVLINVVGLIDFDRIEGKSQFADYEVYSNVVNGQYIPASQVSELEQKEGIEEVYYQKLGGEMVCTADYENAYTTRLVVYSDNLYTKFMKQNGLKGLDVQNDDIAIVASFDDNGYQCSNITITGADWFRDQNPDIPEETVVKVNQILYDPNSLLGGALVGEYEGAYLIINEKLAEKIYGSVENYTDILISCSAEVTVSDIRSMLGEEDYTYTDIKSTLEVAKTQLLGMGYLCIYILLSVSVLSVLIINNIIRSNIVNRIREIGMLRSIGAEKSVVQKLLCRETMVLAGRAVLTACVIALPISLWISLEMNDRYQFAVIGYILGGAIVLCGCRLFSFSAVKKYLSANIREMLNNE